MKTPSGLRGALKLSYALAAIVAALPSNCTASGNGVALSTNIHQLIVSQTDRVTEATMRAYTNTIPGTNVTYGMVPLRGGEFVLGSANGEPGRSSDECPQRRVRIEPFWMGVCEATWNEYETFLYRARGERRYITVDRNPYTNALADAVAMPSMPYIELSMGMGREGYPAINMTQHAANKYCQWLSALTGHYYRLPTEAEWEYACRAGTTTAYFFGNDPNLLDDYAWYAKNSDFKYQKVGKKKSNPWGLCDMYGNVVEWCLDQYDPNFYKQFANSVADNPWNRATKPYPHVVRGGSWDDDDAHVLRSAARRGSD